MSIALGLSNGVKIILRDYMKTKSFNQQLPPRYHPPDGGATGQERQLTCPPLCFGRRVSYGVYIVKAENYLEIY